MAVLFDTSILLLAIFPDAKPPIDPATEQPVEHVKQRVEYLIRKLSKERSKVVIPAPVLTEMLIHAGKATNEYVQGMQQPPFRIAIAGPLVSPPEGDAAVRPRRGEPNRAGR